MSPGRHGISDQEKPEPRGKVYGRGGWGVYSGGLHV